MKLKFESSFLRDVKKVREKIIQKKLMEVIEEVERAVDLTSIGNIKKLKR